LISKYYPKVLFRGLNDSELISTIIYYSTSIFLFQCSRYFYDSKTIKLVLSVKLKGVLVSEGLEIDWFNLNNKQFLRAACQVKNIWIPYGD